MAKDIKLDQLLGITKEPLETMSHAEMLSNNLKLQHDKISNKNYFHHSNKFGICKKHT